MARQSVIAAVWELRRGWWQKSIFHTGHVGKSGANRWGREAGSELSDPGREGGNDCYYANKKQCA